MRRRSTHSKIQRPQPDVVGKRKVVSPRKVRIFLVNILILFEERSSELVKDVSAAGPIVGNHVEAMFPTY